MAPKANPACRRCVVVVVLVALMLLCGWVSRGFAKESPVDVEALAVRVAEAEQRLTQLRVDAQSETQRLVDGSWVREMFVDLSAEFVGVPGGKARVDFHRMIVPWTNGPQPFSESIFNIAFNGRVGTAQYFQHGVSGQRRVKPVGEIGSRRPVDFELATEASGWTYSLYGVFDLWGLRLSNALTTEFVESGNTKLSTREVDGRTEIVVEWASPDSSEIFYLDPLRDFALTQRDLVMSDRLVMRTTITELVQPAPGVWYPKQFEREGFGPDGSLHRRARFVASSITANGDVDEERFVLEFVHGSRLTNLETGDEFVLGEGSNAERVLLERFGEDLRIGWADSVAPKK